MCLHKKSCKNNWCRLTTDSNCCCTIHSCQQRTVQNNIQNVSWLAGCCYACLPICLSGWIVSVVNDWQGVKSSYKLREHLTRHSIIVVVCCNNMKKEQKTKKTRKKRQRQRTRMQRKNNKQASAS